MKNQKRLLLAACCCMILQVYAQSDGSLDPSFASGGVGSYSVGPPANNSDEEFRAVLPMPDGRVIVAGNCAESNGDFNYYRIVVTRINTDGSIDSSFGQNGTGLVFITNGLNDNFLACAALQSDGKILLAGKSTDKFSVVRLNENGSLDSSFDDDGKLAISAGRQVQSIALQNDGKILLAGYGYNYYTSSEDLVVVRLNTDGSHDNSFDGDGEIKVDVKKRRDRAQSIAIQDDGKILLGGYSYFNSSDLYFDILVVRLNANGELDSSFRGNGKLLIPVGSREYYANSIALLKNGKILLGGYSFNGSDYDFAIARLNANGNLDNSFDDDGKKLIPVGSGDDVAYSMTLRSNGKILLGGYSFNGSDNDFVVVRLNDDGGFDSNFNGNGKKLIQVGSGDDVAYAMNCQNDGKILVAGYSSNGSNNDLAVLRLKVGGTIDHSFNGKGKLLISLLANDKRNKAESVALQTDGKILLAGSSFNGSNYDFSAARLNTDGSLDKSFGGAGKLLIPIGNDYDNAGAITLQSDGKILLAGNSITDNNSDFSIVRLHTDGSLDKSFDGDGKLLIHVGSYSSVAKSIAVQKNRKIIVAGSYNGSFAVVRLKANGSLDSSFKGDGKLIIGSGSDHAECMALQEDGKILLGGFSGGFDFLIIRLKPDGSLDKSFGGDGRLTIPVGSGSDLAYSIAVQNDGKILLAGVSGVSYNAVFSIVRLNANGSLDTSFNGDGKKLIEAGNFIDYVHSIAVQNDGKILLTGNRSGNNNFSNSDFVLVRLNPNGGLDSSFDNDGIANISTPFYRETAMASALQPDGKLIVAGYGDADEPGEKFIAMRFLCGSNSISQPDNHFVTNSTEESDAEVNNSTAKLSIPNPLHRTQPLVIQGLPANNNILITDINGRILFRQTNYQNDKAFTGWAQGVYYYRISFMNKEGKPEVFRGKLLLVP